MEDRRAVLAADDARAALEVQESRELCQGTSVPGHPDVAALGEQGQPTVAYERVGLHEELG